MGCVGTPRISVCSNILCKDIVVYSYILFYIGLLGFFPQTMDIVSFIVVATHKI